LITDPRRSADQDFVVVAGRRAIAATGFVYRQDALVLGFQLAVGKAQGAQQFDAANLKPDQVVGIVDNAHLVGLGIAHSHLGCY
jgi:hypothetical protein